MAVLQMQRISICALKKNRKAILERLQELGAIEVDIQLEDDSGYEKMDVSNSRATFEKQAQTADRALEILQQYAPEKAGLLDSLAGKPLIEKEVFEKVAKNRENYAETARRIVGLDRQVAEKKANVLKLQNQIESLAPWMSLTVPMNYRGTDRTAVLIGTIAGERTLEEILGLLAEAAPNVEAVDIQVLSSDKDYTYLTVVCLRAELREVEEALRGIGFARPTQSVNKIPAEYKEELLAELEKTSAEIENLQKEIAEYAGSRQDMRLISDYYRIRAEKYEILGKLPQTGRTFALSGYVPAYDSQRIVQEISSKYDAVVEVEEIKDEEEPPILLKNNKFSESVEGVLASFGLPGKGEMDPSFFTSIFYVFLFGLMLSDAAYGLIIAVACGAALLKFPRMEQSLRKSVKLFFWCGLSTLVWGVLFGGYFGDVVDVVSETFLGHKVTIPALWFVPLNNPMRLLLYSMLFGLIHLFTGLALKGYMCLRDKRYLDFVCDCVLWFLLLLGLIGMLLPSDLFAGIAGQQIVFPAALSAAAKWSAIIGAVGILLMSGRANKNFGVRIALGAYDLYNITGWLSDVLSYSRLLALGLATGVIASVVNQMGSMAGNGIFGAIVFIIVFVIGHTFNLAINLLGAYVHTNRLQYVEFFGKFYEGGGRAFNPFTTNTKYVDIKEES
jgi:V/A-type H+-transporting ATPase subunit I